MNRRSFLAGLAALLPVSSSSWRGEPAHEPVRGEGLSWGVTATSNCPTFHGIPLRYW